VLDFIRSPPAITEHIVPFHYYIGTERSGLSVERGIGALYRRYRSKDELLQRLADDGLRRYIAEATSALAAQDAPWAAFVRFMRRCVAIGTGSLSVRHAGAFSSTEALRQLGMEAYLATKQLLDRTKATSGLRSEIEVGDLSLLFEQLQAIRVSDEARTGELRQRYLALMLDGLHAVETGPLPGPAPQWDEINRRYEG